MASHLTTFNTPLAAFSASRPEFTDFVVGGLIFSASNEDTGPSTRVLLLQHKSAEVRDPHSNSCPKLLLSLLPHFKRLIHILRRLFAVERAHITFIPLSVHGDPVRSRRNAIRRRPIDLEVVKSDVDPPNTLE